MSDEACDSAGLLRTVIDKTIDEAPIGMAIVAADGRFLRVNRALCDLVGYTQAELTGLTFQSITHPEDLDKDLELVARLARGEIPRYRLEKRYLRKDGSCVDVVLSVSVVREDGGSPRFFISQVEDATEQKRSERQERFLAEAAATVAETLDFEESMKRVAEIAVREVADYCIIDVEDGEDFRRAKVAGRDPARQWAYDTLSGVDPGQPSLLHHTLVEGRVELLQSPSDDVLAARAQSKAHLEALRALEIRSMASVPLLVRDGRRLGAIGFLATEGRRPYTEADLRFAERFAKQAALSIDNARLYAIALHATKMRDDVLAMVAHDLRNPLNRILLHAQGLRRDPGRSTQAERCSVVIERAVGQMNSLIRDLLDAARIDELGLAVETTTVSADELLVEAAESLRAIAQGSSVDLGVEIAAPAGDVRADRGRVLQVLDNLIANALKFTPAGGQVRVGAWRSGDEVVFRIRDTGRGIGPDELPRLFDRFWQARKTRAHGAGLGLAIAKGIVEAHGGRIWVTSKPGEGSSFHFTIPCAPPARHAPQGELHH